uniref:Carboxylesterase type B domain-containing protein n=1 Tax=Astatotilapia calliptera TaxID=8154 RepID=A0A3P8RHH2_ASTCA
PVDELFRKHELHAVPFMTGVNNDEGGWILLLFCNVEKKVIWLGISLVFCSPKLDRRTRSGISFEHDAGAPVYLYEYQHPPKFLQQKRLSFVGSDHGDEIFIVLGFYHDELLGELCSSPNGHNLVHWPKYGAEEKYLAIGLKKQVTAQHLKKERFVFLTQTVPEKIKQHEENAERSEL